MNLFDNPIISAYKNQASKNILTESIESRLGSDDLLIDQLIEEELNKPEVQEFVQIFEELTDSEKHQANRWGNSGGASFYREAFVNQHPNAAKAFAAHRYTEGMGRIRIPLGSLDDDESKPHNDVVGHLKMHGYDVDHQMYKNGLVSKKIVVGNPEKGIPMQEKTVHKRIGAVLNEIGAGEHIKRAFEKDPFRTGAKTNQYDMILTHNPEDVYGMSTGRGWTSCAQMRRGEKGYKGPASEKMQDEINNHTHVAYLVPKGGNVDKDAVARIAFKKHKSIDGSHETLIDESNVYGTAPRGFMKAARHEVGKLFPVKDNLIYKKNSEVYSDNGRSFVFGKTPDKDSIDKAWATTKPKEESERGEILQHIQPGEKYKSTKLNQVSKAMKQTQDHIAAGDFHAAYESLGGIHQHLTTNEARTMGYGRGEHKPIINELKDQVAGLFDPSKSSHLDALRAHANARYHNTGTIYGDIMSKAYMNHSHKPIRTADDVLRHVKVTSVGMTSSPYESKMNFADNHQFGAKPVMKVAKILSDHGMLNKHTLQQAYFGSSGHRSGNLYDHIVKLAQDDVPGSHEILDQTAQELNGKTNEKSVASSFRYSKPETRRVLASKMGIDHNKLLRKYKKEFDAEDAHLEELKRKAAESHANHE